MVASRGRARRRARRPKSRHGVSIPFIAGQWSLPVSAVAAAARGGGFQSPSLRGSGRFKALIEALRDCYGVFQSPSLRGSGRFPVHRSDGAVVGGVFQSPSLRGSGRFGACPRPVSGHVRCFNPLHCGAVVASRMALKGKSLVSSFNPLHCGAVVASCCQWSVARRPGCVSIPFIAGQWSLPGTTIRGRIRVVVFQSPSLRGSGRFCKHLRGCSGAPQVSIPFIAGQWSLQEDWEPDELHALIVSIPFIAGQWSLLIAAWAIGWWFPARFNPLHCGAVVASSLSGVKLALAWEVVSIPFIAGQWSLPAVAAWRAEERAQVSIPFIAGQWSLRSPRSPHGGGGKEGFNPLHCGAVVASMGRGTKKSHGPRFQSPSLRGSGRFARPGRPVRQDGVFQSPSLRGSGRFGSPPRDVLSRGGPVSIPFIAGQWSLHAVAGADEDIAWAFQSPSLRGSGRFRFRR